MTIGLEDIVAWALMGIMAGSLAGMLVKRSKQGFGHWLNLGIGLVGALLGGVIFRVIPIARGLARFKITLEDLVAALVGSLIFLTLLWWLRRRKERSSPTAS